MKLTEKKTLQFELWQECNNKCKFCFLGTENRFTADDIKIASLKKTIEKISDESIFKEYNCLAFIGGEFYQGQLQNPEVKKLFYTLMDKSADLLNRGVIEEFWTSATLTIGKQEDLYNCLEKFNDKSKVWVLTSWDAYGRFHTPKMLETWEYHMKHLKERFPDIKLNTTIVLTGIVMEKYLSGEIPSFEQFCEKYNTSLFFKQPAPFFNIKDVSACTVDILKFGKIKSEEEIPHFFPTRSLVLEFYQKFKENETENMWTRLFNVAYRADILERHFNDNSVVTATRNKNLELSKNYDIGAVTLPCGHTCNFAAYIDSDRCWICDKELFE
jgi:hypothetical protein